MRLSAVRRVSSISMKPASFTTALVFSMPTLSLNSAGGRRMTSTRSNFERLACVAPDEVQLDLLAGLLRTTSSFAPVWIAANCCFRRFGQRPGESGSQPVRIWSRASMTVTLRAERRRRPGRARARYSRHRSRRASWGCPPGPARRRNRCRGRRAGPCSGRRLTREPVAMNAVLELEPAVPRLRTDGARCPRTLARAWIDVDIAALGELLHAAAELVDDGALPAAELLDVDLGLGEA
jgi:hypothetical protein